MTGGPGRSIGATIRETLHHQPVVEFTSRGVDDVFDVMVNCDDGSSHTYTIPPGRIVFLAFEVPRCMVVNAVMPSIPRVRSS